ncbi:alpha/beta hydrolase [Psychrobacter sp. FDAARGOS_221]|uniref:alpha/beta hydrolase n=1 Tax=Psychrobacter sp. FDAARGOS_221 TaxID=1975705 RepID=UPI000BB577CA|nr:alpha/beta hydrolase [Psychrobacter sp. FDAARGOS_221]PNK61159.1 alpha/beta hydrolase [Psychrobacter sp. FDAARGOS_221]
MKALQNPALQKLAFKVQKNIVKRIIRLPTPIKQKIAGQPIKIDGQTFDVSLQMLLKLFSPPPNYLASVAETRAEFDEQGSWLAQPAIDDIITDEFKLDVSGGDSIRLRRYRHRNAPHNNQPALVFYHGGGYVGGSLASHDQVCQHLAQDSECTVISVDYRLAPEYPFPTPVNDGLTAYRYIASHAKKFGVDASRLAVGGDSAGANLAAVVAQQTKEDDYSPKLQLLWVPWVDMSQERQSYELFASGFFLERAKMRWYTDHYLGDKTDRTDPMASPLFGDVKGVASAVVMVAGFDPLRDEGIEYAGKLKEAGVDTELNIYETMPHVFINVAGEIEDAKVAFADATRALKRL